MPFSKYSRVNLTTVPDSINTAIRFGIIIRPLNVSAISHRSPRSIVAPMIATNAYTTINGFINLLPIRNPTHLEPYSPQPRIVENAKQQRATAVNIDIQFPYVATKPFIVRSAPAACPYAISVPLHRMTRAVSVHITMVSMNTSNIPKDPAVQGALHPNTHVL